MDVKGIVLDKYFRKKSSVFLAIVVSIIIIIVYINNINSIIGKCIFSLCIIGINIFYIIDVIRHTSLPKSKEGRNAILIRIITKDEEEYKDIKFKFGTEFEKFIEEDHYSFEVVYIPYNLVEKNNTKKKEDIIRLLKRTNCLFLIDIKSKSEILNEDTIYVTELNLGILHPNYTKNVEEKLQDEINILGCPISKLQYSKKEKIEKLEITAKKITEACEYIIGRTNYLNGNNTIAKEIGDKLIAKLNDVEANNIIVYMTKCLCYDTCIEEIIKEYNRKDINYKIISEILQKANRYINGTYKYYEGMSVCAFQTDRDIKKVKDYLGLCKQCKPQGSWKYSIAFLSAYEGEAEGKVLYKYLQALKIEYNHMQLIHFIEEILEKEEKNMLRFALVILYSEIKEYKVAKEILNEYLNNKETHLLEENTIKKLTKRYGNNIFN